MHTQIGCNNRTPNAKTGYCTIHCTETQVATTVQGRILYTMPLGDDKFGVIAFHVGNGVEEFCDQFCSSGFLSTHWELAPEIILAHTYCEQGSVIEVGNVESPVQAFRFWEECGDDFKGLSGKNAVLLENRLVNELLINGADITYGSYGDEWLAKLAMNSIKFKPGAEMARPLVEI